MGWATYYIEKLKMGEIVQFRPRGNSMIGKVDSGQLVTVEPITEQQLQKGDIVLCKVNGHQYMKSNFGEYMDFWDLTDAETQSVLNGLTIATTIDGDIVVVIDNKCQPIILLPRHSSSPIYFDSFGKVVDYYKSEYIKDELYFDTTYNYEQEYISFIINNKLDKALFEQVRRKFLNTIPFDKSYNIEIQPKYVIQKIGGWV